MATATPGQIHDDYGRALTAIRARQAELVPTAFRTQLATAYVTAKSAMDAYRAANGADTAASVDGLRKKLFGPPSGVSAGEYRDALTAASVAAVGGVDGLTRCLNRAELVGDDALARAVFTVAQEDGAAPVVDAYLAAHPDADAVYAQLVAVAGAPRTGRSRLIDGMVHSIALPAELAGLGALGVEQLARTTAGA